MIKTIIFDFNRTIYDPELDLIENKTINLLRYFKSKNIKLALITTYEKNRNKKIIQLKLNKYFDLIKITREKTVNDFLDTLLKLSSKPKDTVVVGDYLKDEINIGNILGLTTIWLKKGKFSNVSPENKFETPDYIIEDLIRLKEMIIYLNNTVLLNQKETAKNDK